MLCCSVLTNRVLGIQICIKVGHEELHHANVAFLASLVKSCLTKLWKMRRTIEFTHTYTTIHCGRGPTLCSVYNLHAREYFTIYIYIYTMFYRQCMYDGYNNVNSTVCTLCIQRYVYILVDLCRLCVNIILLLIHYYSVCICGYMYVCSALQHLSHRG